MKTKKVTKEHAKWYLERTLDLKEKINTLKAEREDINTSIKVAEEKLNRRLGNYKKIKEEADDVEEKRKYDKIIRDYSSDVEVAIKKIVGKNLYSNIRKEFPTFRKVCLDIQEVIDNIEIWFTVRYGKISEVIRYTFRLIKKLPEWLPLLYRDYEWGFGSVLDIIEFKLNKLQKCLNEGHYIGCEKDATEVRIAIEHIKRYKNIEDYTLDYDRDYDSGWWKLDVCAVDEDGLPTLYTHTEKNPEKAKKRHKIFMAQEQLAQFHWRMIWSTISKRAQRWVD